MYTPLLFCHYFLIELEDLFKKLPKKYMYLKSEYDNIVFEYSKEKEMNV